MWRKHRSTFQDHGKYIHNDTVKPFRLYIIHYTVRWLSLWDELPSQVTTSTLYEEAGVLWVIFVSPRQKFLWEQDSIFNKVRTYNIHSWWTGQKNKDYSPVPHKGWYELLFTMEENDNIKRVTDQIKIITTSKAYLSNSDSNTSEKVPCKNKERTGVLPACKHKGKRPPNHKGYQN